MNFESRIEQWIHSVKVPVVTHEDIETPPEDDVSTVHLSIGQLKAKQALAHLKLKQLTQKQEFANIKQELQINPVFGCVIDVARDRLDSQRRKPKPKRATLPDERGIAFSTQEIVSREGQSSPGHKEAPNTRYAVCPVCNAAHPLAKCKIFIEKNFEERLQVMRKAQLCHNCFKYGHIAVGCLAGSTCEVQGCKSRHHTLLYPPPSQQSVENGTRAVEQGTQVSRTGCSNFSGASTSTLAIPK